MNINKIKSGVKDALRIISVRRSPAVFRDHAGGIINIGDAATMDSGHSKGDDWQGEIVEVDGWPYFKYYENGDEVELTKHLCSYIEVER